MSQSLKPAYIPQAWETVDCPFCGSADCTLYEKFGSEMQYSYVTCGKCKLIYQSPRPVYNQHFIDAAYADYYQYSDSLTINDFAAVKESGVKMFQEEMDHLMKYDQKRTAVLDIGSGMGTFLFAAKPHYKEAVGLDVSEKMAAFVKEQLGVNVIVQQFEHFEYPRKFSLIHMSHVIEHIPDPNGWLQKAATHLEEDGILVVNVPNKRSLSFVAQHLWYKLGLKKQFASDWNDPSRTPDHLFEPVIPAMKYVIEKNGLEILEYFTYSRKDPSSTKSWFSRFMNRTLKVGSNLSFITRVKK
ncbi:MAG: methyltransferase domain-containing protein [Chitinophagaceae bacterium]|nr:methyltransferase domain-containing protein [Chitinophagaceae bacterium]